MVTRTDLYEPNRGVPLEEGWAPRLPELQLRARQNYAACQDGHLTTEI